MWGFSQGHPQLVVTYTAHMSYGCIGAVRLYEVSKDLLSGFPPVDYPPGLINNGFWQPNSDNKDPKQ